MRKIRNFEFNAVVLYSKGWYGITTENDFMELVARLIKLDDAYCTPKNMNNETIATYMLIALDKIHQHLDEDDRRCGRWLCSPLRFYEEVNRQMRICDCTREEAIVLSVLNVMMMLSNDEIDLNLPKYGKGLPRYTGGKFSGKDWHSITYTYMEKNARNFFIGKDSSNYEKRHARENALGLLMSQVANKEYRNWYFTFGVGDEKNKHKYVRIVARTEMEARERMCREYGTAWAFDYDEHDWIIDPKAVPERWNLLSKWHGINPNRTEPITQAELYGLSEIYLGIVK